jgi:hypothetical protein
MAKFRSCFEYRLVIILLTPFTTWDVSPLSRVNESCRAPTGDYGVQDKIMSSEQLVQGSSYTQHIITTTGHCNILQSLSRVLRMTKTEQ